MAGRTIDTREAYDELFQNISPNSTGYSYYGNMFKHVRKLYEETIKNGGKELSRSDVKKIMGKHDFEIGDYKSYQEWFSDNAELFSGNNLINAQHYMEGYTDDMNISSNINSPTYTTEAFNALMNKMGYTPQDIQLQQMQLGELNEAGLTTDYQALLDAQNAVINQQYAAEMDELARAENDMYRAVGLSQRQMERDIAKRRQQALKSGMSTAQLAAQEQQNILTAQLGATQIAQDYANKRYGVINQFAGANAQNYVDVLAQQQKYAQGIQEFNNNLMNQQTQFNAQQKVNWAQALSNVYPQNYAADKYGNQGN